MFVILCRMQKFDSRLNNNVKSATSCASLNLRLFRKIIGKTQHELAADLDVSRSTISNIERGVTFIRVDYLDRMYRKFGLNINWLLTGKGNIFISKDQKLPAGVSINEKYFELFELMQIPAVEEEILKTLKEAKSLLAADHSAEPGAQPE